MRQLNQQMLKLIVVFKESIEKLHGELKNLEKSSKQKSKGKGF
jgi:hypothetical protein